MPEGQSRSLGPDQKPGKPPVVGLPRRYSEYGLGHRGSRPGYPHPNRLKEVPAATLVNRGWHFPTDPKGRNIAPDSAPQSPPNPFFRLAGLVPDAYIGR